MAENVAKTSSISIQIDLDANHLPMKMNWSATDGGINDSEAAAFLLSIWDVKEKNTMKIDLWTKDMTIDEMKQFFHQTLLTMADTFEKATGEHLISEDLRDYCYHFAEKMNILPVFIITEKKWNWEHAIQMGLEVNTVVDKDTNEVVDYNGQFIYVDRETINTIEDVAAFILDLL
ncbi:MAG: gliding motility protein GldC, partial [Flavobacteriales bacterium]|nr:gliding motility protein GldC [Flavobacteriales bacterium]